MEVDTPPTARAPEPDVTELPAEKRSSFELSSNTDTESCEAYISRTVEMLASVEPVTLGPNNELPAETKISISDPVAITPGLNEFIPEEEMPESVPRVVFLDKPVAQITPTGVAAEDQNMLAGSGSTEKPTLVPDSVTQQGRAEEGMTEASTQGEQ